MPVELAVDVVAMTIAAPREVVCLFVAPLLGQEERQLRLHLAIETVVERVVCSFEHLLSSFICGGSTKEHVVVLLAVVLLFVETQTLLRHGTLLTQRVRVVFWLSGCWSCGQELLEILARHLLLRWPDESLLLVDETAISVLFHTVVRVRGRVSAASTAASTTSHCFGDANCGLFIDLFYCLLLKLSVRNTKTQNFLIMENHKRETV